MWYLRTFGGLSIESDRRVAGPARRRRPLALLALLAAAGERGLSREKVVALLWPESDEEHGRNSLSQALAALRRDTGVDELVVGGPELRLNPEVITSDVAEFERCIASGVFERAAALYQGPFLDGFFIRSAAEFERWADEQRRRFHDLYASTLQRLSRAADERSDHEAAVAWWKRLASLEPTSAPATAGLMRALVNMGERSGARRQYQVYTELMRQEFGVAPEPAVSDLAANLFTDRVAPSVVAEVPPPDGRAAQGVEKHAVTTPPPANRGTTTQRDRWLRARIVPRAAAIALLALTATALDVALHAHTPGAPTDPRVVAMFYIQTPRRGDSLQYLSEALTESVIKRLESTDRIRVIPSGGVRPFRDVRANYDSVARALAAGTLVRGTLSADGRTLHIALRVTDGATGKTTIVDSVQGTRNDGPALEADLTARISKSLERRLGLHIDPPPISGGTRNAAAWDLFQRAWHTRSLVDSVLAYHGPEVAMRQIAKADSEFAMVAALDSTWPAPIVARGFLAIRKTQIHPVVPSVAQTLEIASRDASRALALAQHDPDALELRGTVRFLRSVYNPPRTTDSAQHILADAESDFREAIKSNPRQASAWSGLSSLLEAENKHRMAGAAAREAYIIDPFITGVDKIMWRAFVAARDLPNAAEATRWCETGRRRFPSNFRFVECQLWLKGLRNQSPAPAELWALYRAYVAQVPKPQREYAASKGKLLVALGLVRASLPDSADRVVVRARADLKPALDPAAELDLDEAIVRTALQQYDVAFRLLESYYQRNRDQIPDETGWWFEDLWTDARWLGLTTRREG